MILVTGANGFVGKHLVKHLLSLGYHVISLVRDHVNTEDKSKAIDTSNRHHIVVGDLANSPEIPFDVDIVFHLAGQIVLPQTTDEDFSSKNKNATEGLIGSLGRLDVNRVINLSTTSIYGAVVNGAAFEHMPPREPNAYATSKYKSEQVLSQFDKGISLTHVRTPGIIGSGANPNLISNLVALASAGLPVELSNLQTDFNNVVHVSDVCSFLSHLLDRKPIIGCDSVNLASSKPITINNMAKLIIEHYGNRSSVMVKSSSVAPYIIDIEKLRKIYNFEPLTVSQAIARFLDELHDSK